jgi:hypothetical protein
MAGNEKQQITRETIGGICERFGFVYQSAADGHDSVMIGDEIIEITFREDGTLSEGRNKFLAAAREASTDFAGCYPPSKEKKSYRGGKKKPKVKAFPKLDKAFLMAYTGEELGALQNLLPEVLTAKAAEKKRLEQISALEERNTKLRAVLDAVEAAGISVPTGVEDEISKNDKALADLRSQKE